MVTEEARRLVLRTQRLALRGTTIEDAAALHAMQNNPNTIRYLHHSASGFSRRHLFQLRDVDGPRLGSMCKMKLTDTRRPKAAQVEPYPIETVREVLEDRLLNNHLHMIIYLLPEEKHLPTPEGHSPYDANLEFPSITAEEVCGNLIGSVIIRNDYNIGYLICYEEWGKGFAAEAAAEVLREIWRGAAKGKYGTLPRGIPEGATQEREYVFGAINPENRASGRVLEKVGGILAGTQDVEDWDQTAEERERDGVKMFKLQFFRMYKPESLDCS